MRPAILRGVCRVTLDDMARRLHVTAADLRVLEASPLGFWEVDVLGEYCRVLGYRIRLVAVRTADGAETELAV